MKLYLFSIILAFLLLPVNAFAQKNGNVTYVTYGIRLINKVGPGSQKEKDMDEQIVNGLKDVECELFFDETSSLFRRKEKLGFGCDFGYTMAAALAGGIQYKNLKEKLKIEQRESLGETFRVIYPFEQYQWEITKETKKIGDYLCYKAEALVEGEDLIKATKKMNKMIAWFTPEIPVSFGPKGIDGLPGLVLEGISNEKVLYYMKTITFNYSDVNHDLQKPKGGIEISDEKYQELLKEKMLPILRGKN
ncbi:GLPGLI family protein [Sinomicrobium sp. M5D2P17]